MQDYATVLETMERDVYHVESGLTLPTLTAATIYQLPHTTPQLVLTRGIYTRNVTDVTVSYTLISGATLEDWKRNLEEANSMLWRPVQDPINGPKMN